MDLDHTLSAVRQIVDVWKVIKEKLEAQQKIQDLVNIPNWMNERHHLQVGEFNNLRIKGLKFSYNYSHFSALQFGEDEEIVFERGNRYGIVGQNMAGKSTLTHIICKLYEPQGGFITMNGIPYEHIGRKFLRDMISYTSQTPFLFPGTIRDNILIGNPDASEEEGSFSLFLPLLPLFFPSSPSFFPLLPFFPLLFSFFPSPFFLFLLPPSPLLLFLFVLLSVCPFLPSFFSCILASSLFLSSSIYSFNLPDVFLHISFLLCQTSLHLHHSYFLFYNEFSNIFSRTHPPPLFLSLYLSQHSGRSSTSCRSGCILSTRGECGKNSNGFCKRLGTYWKNHSKTISRNGGKI